MNYSLYFDKYKNNANIIIFVKLGSFYEVFGERESFQIKTCENILNLTIMQPRSRNFFMTGFPCSSVQSKLELLLSNDITVVFLDSNLI